MEASFNFLLVFGFSDAGVSQAWLFDKAFFVDVADIFFGVGVLFVLSRGDLRGGNSDPS
jgi:hypothetical protein